MIVTVDNYKYAALLGATRPGVITDEGEAERLTDEINYLVTKALKGDCLSPEEEKLLALLVRLVEDYEQEQELLAETMREAA